MIVKLSDFILEQTVSNADVIDISMEQAKAEIDVTTSLCDVYIKRGYSHVFTEAESGGFVDTIHKFFVSIGNWFRKMWIKFLGYFSKKRLDKIINKLNSISDSEKKTFKGYLPFDGNRLKTFVSTFVNISDKFSNKINSLITDSKSFNAYDLRDDLQRSRNSVKTMIKSNNESYEYGYDDYYKFMTDLKSQYNENQQTLERIRNTFKHENYKRITDMIDGLSEKEAKKIYKDINRLYTSYSSIATDSITCMMKLVQNAEKNKGSAKQGRLTDDVTRETPSNPTPPNNPNNPSNPSNSNNSNNKSNSNNPTPPNNPNNPSNPTPPDNPTNNDQKTDTKKKKETLTKSELDKYFEDSINSFKSIISKAKTIKDDTKEYIKSIDSFVKEDKDVADSIERLDDIGTNLIPNLLKELDNIHKNVYMPILTEAVKQHSLDDNDYLEAEIQAGKRAQDIMNQIRNSLDSIEGLHKSIDSKVNTVKPDKNDDTDIGKIDNALFDFIKQSRLFFDYLRKVGVLSEENWKKFKTCTIGAAKNINKSDAEKIASWFISKSYQMQGMPEVGRIYEAITSYPEELKLGGDVNWCKPSELNASKTKAMLFEINEAIRLMKSAISEKKKAQYFTPEEQKTIDSVKAIKLAKQNVFIAIQNFITDFTSEYHLVTDDAFRFNLNTNDYDSPQLTEIANKLDKFCKSKPANVSEKHIKDLSEIADMINSVSKLVSDPNNYGPNFIADMAKYSKRATALSKEFDSGKKQKESSDTQSNETKKKETKDEQQIPEDRLRRLEKGLDETIKVIRPLDDRKYWVIFPELYDEYKTIYDAIIKYYEDMRGKLNTNETIKTKSEYMQLVNLGDIIKESDKLLGLKRESSIYSHLDSPEYNIISALRVATAELDIYKYIPRQMYVTKIFTNTGDSKEYHVATCTDVDFDRCIKYRESRNEMIAKYTKDAEKRLKKQKDSADESKKSGVTEGSDVKSGKSTMKSGKSTGKTNAVGTQTDDTLNAKIFEELSKIEEIDDIKYELNKFKEGLSKLKYDKDDPEDYNNALHQLIDKYIYSSDKRVSVSDWSKIERFLKAIGYKRLDIKPGQSITPYRTYFKQPIMAKTDDKSKDMTIKQVQQQPYTKKVDGQEYKLCGKCTYWKFDGKSDNTTKTTNGVINPNVSYIDKLINELGLVEKAFGKKNRFYNELASELQSLKDNIDEYDSEEIMSKIHRIISSNVYKSLIRVSSTNKRFLYEYLNSAGYKSLNIKPGENINDTIDYWENIYAENCDDESKDSKIYQITEQPYIIEYNDGGSSQKLILKGECSYWKYNAS